MERKSQKKKKNRCKGSVIKRECERDRQKETMSCQEKLLSYSTVLTTLEQQALAMMLIKRFIVKT